jgi:hypothetical protein
MACKGSATSANSTEKFALVGSMASNPRKKSLSNFQFTEPVAWGIGELIRYVSIGYV